jgi:hypothetical protein
VFIDNPQAALTVLAHRDRKSSSPSEFCMRFKMKAFLRLITLTSAFALLLVFPGFAAEPEGLGPDKWPTTVQDTVKDILSRMSEKDKELVRSTKSGDLIMFHHGWGTGIRNYYGLWRGNQKLIVSACGMPCQPDDASMIIIRAVWQELPK